MTPAEALATQLAEGQRLLETVMGDVTPEMLTWAPPGTSNPTGVIYAQPAGAEDLYIQQIIQGLPY
jgi:hypothetical protein